MSVNFISGAPGNGKSLYAVRLIVGELTRGTRPIVTNLALRPGELNAYLQREFPEKSIDLLKRLRILSDEQIGTFFLYRVDEDGTWRDIEPVSKEDEAKGKRPSFAGSNDKGVLYVLDEIHERFNARAWMETGRSALYYLSQHRKLGDDVICITQSVGNVDKQFRSVAQDFTTITNLSKRKISIFRMPPLFMRRVYPTAPTGQVQAMETTTFTLDAAGLASCYDTAKGVGLQGRLADTKERRRGVSLGWGVAAIVILLGAGMMLPKVIAGRLVGGMKQAGKQAGGEKLHPATNGQAVAMAAVPQTNTTLRVEQKIGLPPTPETGSIYITSRVKMPRGYVWSLSNGEYLAQWEGDVLDWSETKVLTREGRIIKVGTPQTVREHGAMLSTENKTSATERR